MQERQRLVEKAVWPFLRARLRRSSHGGDKLQMIFDPWSNISFWKPVPFSVVPGHVQSADHPRMPGRKKIYFATLGAIFTERAKQDF